jgi:hypothetical protein
MSEGKKTLHQAASTLKKNPSRIDRLVKEAAMRIVPAARYATGNAKKMAEQAIAKLKEPKGFGGADLSTKSSKFFKEASDKSREVMGSGAIGAAVTGGAAALAERARTKRVVSGHVVHQHYRALRADKGSMEGRMADTAKRNRRLGGLAGRNASRAGKIGAIVGGALGAAAALKKEASDKTRDAALTVVGAGAGATAGHLAARIRGESKVLDRVSNATMRDLKSDRSISHSLDRQSTYERRGGKLVSKAKGKARLVGAAIGAASALAAGKLEKKAAAKPVIHKGQHLLPKGAPIPAGAKDVSPKAVLKGRVNKAGKVAVGLAAGAALAGAVKNHLEKKAAKNDGKGHLSVSGATLAGAGYAASKRLGKDSQKAQEGLKAQIKHIQSKGGRIAPIDVRMAVDSLKKPLARRAGKAALKGGALGAAAAAGLNKLMDNHKATARKNARLQKQAGETVGSQADREINKVVASKGKKGNTSLQPGKDKGPLKKQAAEMIERNGVKHRKGTPGSAAATMAGIATGLTAGNNVAAYRAAKKHALGEVISRRSILKGVPQQAVLNAAYGYAYGRIRSHFRKKRGEVDTSPAAFAKLKAGK